MMVPRGRPKNSDIKILMIQGLNVQSNLKCPDCNRVFKRHKNLNAHIAAHKAMKNYACDFPGCPKKFVQSSQLNCHKYTHSNEKPFKCPADGCMVRQRHSNRFCDSHPGLKIIKQPQAEEEIRYKFYRNVENLSEAEKNWFEEYMSERARKQTVKRQTATKGKIDDVERLQENREDDEKKIHQEDIQQQIENCEEAEILREQQTAKQGTVIRRTAQQRTATKRKIYDVEGLQEIRGRDKKKIHQEDIQLQIEKLHQNGFQIFYWFVNHVRQTGVDSKALFKKCCNSEAMRVPVTNSEKPRQHQ